MPNAAIAQKESKNHAFQNKEISYIGEKISPPARFWMSNGFWSHKLLLFVCRGFIPLHNNNNNNNSSSSSNAWEFSVTPGVTALKGAPSAATAMIVTCFAFLRWMTTVRCFLGYSETRQTWDTFNEIKNSQITFSCVS